MLKHLLSSEDKLKWWGYGVWVEEPDLEEFLYKGLKCRVKRIIALEKSGEMFEGQKGERI